MLVQVLAEGLRAAVLARRCGRWRPLVIYHGAGAEERARALAQLLERGLVLPAAELGGAP